MRHGAQAQEGRPGPQLRAVARPARGLAARPRRAVRGCCEPRRAAGRQGSAHGLVEGGRAGLDRLVRRLGRRPTALLRWHFVKAGRLAETDAICRLGICGWPRRRLDESDAPVRRRSSTGRARHQVGARRRPQVRLGPRVHAPVRQRQALRRRQSRPSMPRPRCGRSPSYFNLAATTTRLESAGSPSKGRSPFASTSRSTWDEAKANRRQPRRVPARSTKRGGHAVCLVGYTADRFIVRNSWGTGWGDGGFGYASLEYAREAFTEAYGVSI